MARGSLTSTSYAILGLLAVKPWSTYELTQQMERSLGHMWPRAASKLYEEPKKLVDHGLARASEERVGRRPRTVYSITAKGRRSLADWLHEPGEGPVLEWEQLVKVFFSENGTKADALATLEAARQWAHERSALTAAVGHQNLEGVDPFPERSAQRDISVRFLIDFYALVADWARWAGTIVDTWPDDPRDAVADEALTRENLERADAAAARHDQREGPTDEG
jgi:PadR family transcriptional regulator, regulatory protein AphA